MFTLANFFFENQILDPGVSQVKHSKQGHVLYFLQGSQKQPNVLELWSLNLSTHEKSCVATESLFSNATLKLTQADIDRQERLRNFSKGITQYLLVPGHNDVVVIPRGGSLWELKAGNLKKLHDGQASNVDVSALGTFISFVENQNVFLYHRATESLRSITNHCEPWMSSGSAEFVAQEELSRFEGTWWSSSEKWLAFQETDESMVSVQKRQEIYADHIKQVEQRYPYCGSANAQWKLKIFDLKTSTTQTVPLEDHAEKDCYLARAAWYEDIFVFVVLNRAQTHLKILTYDPTNHKVTLLFEDSKKPFVNVLQPTLYFKEGFCLWSCQPNDLVQVIAIPLKPDSLSNSNIQKTLSHPSWNVVDFHAGDSNFVSFVVAANHGLERKAYLLHWVSGEIIPCAPGELFIQNCQVSGSGQYVFLQSASFFVSQKMDLIELKDLIDAQANKTPLNANQDATKTTTHKTSEVQQRTWHHAGVKQNMIPELFEPSLGQFEHDHVTFNYKMCVPKNADPKQKLPAIVYLYGGPHNQVVSRNFLSNDWFFCQYLCSLGFVVFSMDNRGSPNLGYAFESALFGKMGTLDVSDQTAGVSFLKSFDFVDPARIGVFGWSYGGYLTLMCLLKNPDLFKVGVSGAPVTDWKLYDTCYTERYMGNPEKNEQSFLQSNCVPFAKSLKAKLLLIHGMADDNVLFDHSLKLIDALYNANKQFQTIFYPGEKHAIASPAKRLHKYTATANFFLENL